MRSLLVLVVLAAGCGGAATTSEPVASGEASGGEASSGGGWHCWVGDTYVSDCARTAAECEESASSARDMLTVEISCNAQPSAWCYTESLGGSESTTCLASAMSCDGMVDDVTSSPAAPEITAGCAETSP